ncbi:hypothetical protein E2C01_069705 [Portunus trituberculatus]|uniref:Uncharacterized protein n=1 Tax=Portunus trituberculatus TaxID=210409 RepID=A0A5B7I0A7_PORTR|nr:hypothetical protein [Portunus trituberculatus]
MKLKETWSLNRTVEDRHHFPPHHCLLRGSGGKRAFSADPKERTAPQKHKVSEISASWRKRELHTRPPRSYPAAPLPGPAARGLAPPPAEGCVDCTWL